MLNFEKRFIVESDGKSCLLILGKGLCLHNIIRASADFYRNSESLVLLINFTENDKMYFDKTWDTHYTDVTLCQPEKRRIAYLKGGAIIASSRVFLNDMLTEVIKIDKISCIIANNIENIKEYSTTAFLIHIFRKYNKHGLLKAFCQNAHALCLGFSVLEKRLRILMVDKIYFYPRFHSMIKECLSKDIDMVEVKLKLPNIVCEIQLCLIEIINGLIGSFNKRVRDYNIDYESVLLSNFYSILKYDGVIDSKVFHDILDIKNLVFLLFSCDSYTFYSCYKRLYEQQRSLKNEGTWINLSISHILYDKAKKWYESELKMCFCDNFQLNINDCMTVSTNTTDVVDGTESRSLYLEEDMLCKTDYDELKMSWKNVMDKCKDDSYFRYCEKVDDKEAKEINNNEQTKRKKIPKTELDTFNVPEDIKAESNELLDISRIHLYLMLKNVKIKKLTQLLMEFKHETVVLVENNTIKHMVTSILALLDIIVKETNVCIKIQTHNEFLCNEDRYINIVFFNPELGSVRKVEVMGQNYSVKTHFLIYKDSLEEQKYLTEIRNEKNAFEKLIHERAKLPLSLHFDEEYIDLEEHEESDVEYRILVDTRELRAELPFFLYKARNILQVETLSVGDYILSTNTAIERKSAQDFVSSLTTGRLYQQTLSLCYAYKRPYLLLEFDSRPCLSDLYKHNEDTFRNSLIAKFALFMVSMPQIKIIWSNSKLFSTRVIRDLQKKDEGTIRQYESAGTDPVLREVLLSVPGITYFNFRRILKHFINLKDLAFCEFDRLEDVLGRENGKLVYNFFRNKLSE